MKKTLALALIAALAACSGDDDDGGPNLHQGEPNETRAQATPLSLGTPVVATIATFSDLDYYTFTLAAPATIRFQSFDGSGTGCAGNTDPWIVVYNSLGSIMDGQDDASFPTYLCEDFATPLAAGTYYVEVGGWSFPMPYVLKTTIQ